MKPIDLFAFDLDGTVTEEELLPRIARAVGEERRIEELTRRTIAGDVPFESSLRERVAILGKVPVTDVAAIVADVCLCAPLLRFLENNAERCVIVTGNLDVWLTELARRIPVPILSTRARVEACMITGLDVVMDKAREIRRFSGRSICVVGEGHNDLGMFEAAELAIAYGGVHSPADSLFAVASHVIYDPDTLCRLLSRL